ncbi:cation diffusion facilitator family transporter [Candidatus Halocynthiibacter alkanivorans]|uniref:cation diffusion facilitator family transporter n=1 Tax=Candidatus Halocynthiibacter alkanivorans TaxID=2267619 RepID=UPI000DF1229C|nr:cation diffusion facilitator family transporter [Candidatus Halocynthiibacter alkanivorans]
MGHTKSHKSANAQPHQHTHSHTGGHAQGAAHRGAGCGHHNIDPGAGDSKVARAIAVNLLLTVAQVLGGIFSGSLALIADALHNFSDAIALIIAFAARKIARRPASAQMSFGYGRAEVVAALVNYTTLVVLGLYLIYQAVLRFIDPQPVEGWLIIVIAAVALVVDLITAALTYRLSKDSINIRAAFLHNVADAMGSVAVIVAGTLILLYDWVLIDPLVTLMIAVYILWHSYAEVGQVIRILMLATPDGIDPDALISSMAEVDGVADLHHSHVWAMEEKSAAFEAHVVLEPDRWHEADAIKAALKQRLLSQFGITHSTLELECARHACKDTQLHGHAPA